MTIQMMPRPVNWTGQDGLKPLIAPGGCFPPEEPRLQTACTLIVRVDDGIGIYDFTFNVEGDQHMDATQNALLLKKKLMQEGIDVVTEWEENGEKGRTLNTFLPNTFTKITITHVDETVQSTKAECTRVRTSY